MAYNAVGTPRFYISWGDWWQSLGTDVPHYNTLTPVNTYNTAGDMTSASFTTFANINAPVSASGLNYLAVLNHNVTSEYGFQINQRWTDVSEEAPPIQENASGDLGGDTDINFQQVTYKGFSLATFGNDKVFSDLGVPPSEIKVRTGLIVDSGMIDDAFDIGCMVFGKYFDMPHSPDLNLTLSYENGTKTIETRGGASLSNTMWRPPMWGNLGQWELNIPSDQYPDNNAIYNRQKLAHSSRRSWDLSFSYLDKTNVFPKYNSLDAIQTITGHDTDPYQYTLKESGDFFTQVFSKVGKNLPFIFQPDKDVLEFAICKFENDFQAKLVANAVYNTKLKIREVW